MKSSALFSMLLLINITSAFSQNQIAYPKSSDLRLSYNASFRSANTLIGSDFVFAPYGIGFNFLKDFSKGFSYDFGFSFLSTEKQVSDISTFDRDRNVIPIHQIRRALYESFSFHFNLKLLDAESFRFSLSAGPEIIMRHDFNNQESPVDGFSGYEYNTDLGTALELGLIEWKKITDKAGIFASQHYRIINHATIGVFDLEAGLALRLN